MAQLKNLIVNGASRFIGDIFGTNAIFSGNVMPETDNTQSLGDSTHRWKLYGTITGSLDKTFKIKLNNTQYTYDGSANVDLSTIYAPTTGGTADIQALIGNGATTAPKWVNISPSITITTGTASETPKVNVTVLGQSGTAQAITTATTGVYGATKLTDDYTSTDATLAATGKSILAAIQTLDVSAQAGAANKTLTSIAETDGKITGVTYSDIAIAASQITSGTLGTARGGTGNNSFTASRLIYSESATKLSSSGHYASSSKVAINSTSEPSNNLYVNGTSYFNGNTIINREEHPSDAFSTSVGITPLNIFGLKNGYPVYTDPDFSTGNNSVGVYNNTSGGNVVHTRQLYSAANVPHPGTSSGYVITIQTKGAASPGVGGFVQSISSRENAVFVQIFRALVPEGRKVNIASNSMGTSYTDKWLTSQEGTGKWEWYARIVHCGATGTFSNGGHIYLDGAAGTASAPVTWYLAFCNVYDITKGQYDGLRVREADNADTATKAAALSPAGTTAEFWRGDNTWSNELSGGQLKITNYSNTVTIGSGNASYMHFNNSANIPFYFNKSIWVDGDLYPYGTSNTRSLGSSSKRWKTLLIGTADSYGNGEQPIYWDAGVPKATTYHLKAHIEDGSANHLAYYSAARTIDYTPNIIYYNDNSVTTQGTTTRLQNGLLIAGETSGNTASHLVSNTAGVMRFGDGGPQLIFSQATSGSPAIGSDAGAILFTNHDSAGTGSSFHFVGKDGNDNQGGNLHVTAPNLIARKKLTIGLNFINTSYTLYVNGSSYFNGNTTHNGIDYFANGTTYYINNSGTGNLNALTVNNTTASTTTGTGGLIVKGGAGIAGRVTASEFNATRPMIINAGKVYSNISGSNVILPAKTTMLFADGIAIANPGLTGANDVGWLRVTGTAETDMALELATGDDGGTGETIHVRQYNTSNTIVNDLTLLDTLGNTQFAHGFKIYYTTIPERQHINAAGWWKIAHATDYFTFDIYINGYWHTGSPSVTIINITQRNGTAIITQKSGLAGDIGSQIKLGKTATNEWDVLIYIPQFATNKNLGQQYYTFVGIGKLTLYQPSTRDTTTYSAETILELKTVSGVTATSLNVSWADWTNKTTVGPQANLNVAGTNIQSDSIPSASTSTSGVVTTAAQTFAGIKTFTNPETINTTGNGAAINFKFSNAPSANTIYGQNWISLANNGGRFYWREWGGTTDGRTAGYEQYCLPACNAGRTTTATYDIFTSKNQAEPSKGTATRMAYYSAVDTISAASNVQYIPEQDAELGTTKGKINGLFIYGTAYGNETANLGSATINVFSYGDPGPQIRFSANLGTSNAGLAESSAIIWSNNSTSIGTDQSFHFVGQNNTSHAASNVGIVTNTFIGKTRLTVGQNYANTTYTAYINGTTKSQSNLFVGTKATYNDDNAGWYLGADGTMWGTHASSGAHIYLEADDKTHYIEINPDAVTTSIKLGATVDRFTMPKLNITSTADIGGKTSSSPPLAIGSLTGSHIEIDTNEILAKDSDTTTGTLYLQDEDGLTSVSGSKGLYVRTSGQNWLPAHDNTFTSGGIRMYDTNSAGGAINWIKGANTNTNISRWWGMGTVGHAWYVVSSASSRGSTAGRDRGIFWYGNTGRFDISDDGYLTTGNLTIGGASGTDAGKTIVSSSTLYLKTSASASIIFNTNSTNRARFDPSGHFQPESTNTYTLGISGARWKSLFIGTADSYGNSEQPIYWDAGVPKATTYHLKAHIEDGSANHLAYYSAARTIDYTPNITRGATSITITGSSSAAAQYAVSNGTNQISLHQAAGGNRGIYQNAGDVAGGWLLYWPDGSKEAHIVQSNLIIDSGNLYAGVTSSTTERQVHARAAAGDIYLYSQGSATASRGIWLSAHGTGPARNVFNVNTNNITTYYGGQLMYRSLPNKTTHALALKNEFDNHKADIPRAQQISYYSSAMSNGSIAMGYFLSGYDDTPYGGFFVAHYNTPRYVGINSGTYTQWRLLKGADSGAIGGTSTPIYIDSDGIAQPCTAYGSATAATANAVKTTLMTNASTAIYVLGATGTKADTSATVYKGYRTSTVKVYFRGDTGVLMGAAWNDYAEYRQAKDDIEIKPGRVVKEVGDETLELTTERLQRGCSIVSNTFGISIGESETNKLPLAVSGRVLAYPYENKEEFKNHIGWPVCSGPNGTVSIMTEEEEMKYPSRIIGTISAVPDYDIWHGGADVIVDGRVWIKVR